MFVATPDKDAAQLVRENIKLYRPSHSGETAVIYDEEAVCAKWAISTPRKMIDYLALAGDSSDNIPGVKGIGEKTALKYIQEFGISMTDLYNNINNEKIRLRRYYYILFVF